MVRPPAAVVHWARSGQPAQSAPKLAIPDPSLPRWIDADCWWGQVTVSSSRSTVNRSLENNPPAVVGCWVFHLDSIPAWSWCFWNSPVP